MLGKKLNNYHEIESFCKSEGMDTDYFIAQINSINTGRPNKIFAAIFKK